MTIETFAGAFSLHYFNGNCSATEADAIHELAIKHGLAVERPATEADCKSERGQAYGVEPGDP